MAHTFSDDDACRYTNKTAVDHILPKTYAAILDWACPKQPHETYRDVLKTKPDYFKVVKQFNHTVGLDRTDCADLDAGFMQKFIPYACEKLGLFDLKAGKKDDSNPNYIMYKLKRIRNDICHQPKGSAISEKKLDEVDRLTNVALDNIGNLYKIDPKLIDIKKSEIGALVQQVRDAVAKDDSTRTRQYEILLCIDGMREVKTRIEERKYSLTPSSELKVFLREVFHDVVLVIKGDSQNPGGRQGGGIMPYSDLQSNLRNKRLFIEGIAFSGKSTLLRKLREDFLATYKPSFPGIPERYTVVLLMQCSNNRIKTISELIQANFPKTTQKVDTKKTADSLRSAKLLILIDGLDELNDRSEILLVSLIDRFGKSNRASFIFTCRSGTATPVKRILEDRGLSYLTGTMQPIPQEEQNKVLDRYRACIPQPAKTSDIIHGFESLDDTCREYLSWAPYLALLVHLYHNSTPDDMDWSSQSHLMDEILLIMKRKTIDRMFHSGFRNPEISAAETMEVICNISLRMCHQNQETLDQQEMDDIFLRLAKPRKPLPQKFLSTFFVLKPDEKTYHPLHPAHKDFLAAKAICERLEANPENSIVAIIREVLAVETIHEERFRGTFRFILMIFSDQRKTEVFDRCLGEVRHSLTRTNTDFEYWIELASSLPTHDEVFEVCAEATKTMTWSACSGRHMLTLSRMLRHATPPELIASPTDTHSAISALRPLLENINQRFLGKFTLNMMPSYSEFTPTDDFVMRLVTSRCLLVGFTGCLESSKEAGGVLVSCVERTTQTGQPTYLRISLVQPRTHQLGALDSLMIELDVRVRMRVQDDESEGRCALPHGLCTRTSLTVQASITSDAQDVATLIRDLMPSDNRYRRLWIQNYMDDAGVGDEERDRLVTLLVAAGVRTKYDGPHPHWVLAQAGEDGTCEVCEEKVHRPAERCIELLLP